MKTRNHRARWIPYEALRYGLLEEQAKGNVRAVTNGPLELWCYTNQCTYENAWNSITLLARGLVLDTVEERVVATPFPKFFNYGQNGHVLPDESFTVTEKVDGSLGIVFHHGGKWLVATKGSFESEQAAWAEQWIRDHEIEAALLPGTTYCVEIVYPENRIVVPYDFSGLVLLGAYDEQGQELDRVSLAQTVIRTYPRFHDPNRATLRLAKAHSYDRIEDLLRVAQALSSDHEGFVVRFESGMRVKIKGAEYCRIHRLLSRCTPLGVWDVLVRGEDEAMRAEMPDEFLPDFDRICALLWGRFNFLWDEVRGATLFTAKWSDKELGLALQADRLPYNRDVQRFIFPARKENFLEASKIPNSPARQKAFETFRPKNNRLQGYTPSAMLRRIEEEE